MRKKWSIRFEGPMVRAIFAGTKTQTRQVVEPQPEEMATDFVYWSSPHYDNGDGVHYLHTNDTAARRLMLRGFPYSDRLWVREAWAPADGRYSIVPLLYRADGDAQPVLDDCWRPSIHMPRSASRLSLEIAEVRVERLREITEADAIAEGVTPLGVSPEQRIAADERGRTQATHPHTLAFAVLWDEINGWSAPWLSNPWVWAITFWRVEVPAQGEAVPT